MIEYMDWRIAGPLMILTLFIGGGLVVTYLQTVRDLQEKIFAVYDTGGLLAVQQLYEVLLVETGTYWVDWTVEDHRNGRINLGLENMYSGVSYTSTNFRELMPGLPTASTAIEATVAIIRRPWRKGKADHLAFLLTWNNAY